MLLICALCLYDPAMKDAEPRDAGTMINGYAVCAQHAPIVACGAEWAVIVNAMKRAQPVDG